MMPATGQASEGLAVSVVVPVYNPGPHLARSAPSLLHQSLPAEDYEVIYVDDGSTDGAGNYLDRVAAEHPHVRVHHQENSGWPGKPRNVGIAMSRGRYVQFVDQDDELGPEALERLSRYGDQTAADIVIGKLVGSMVGPRRLYAHNVAGASVVESRATESLTGHKMFRRSFLLEHGIRFPEGYWRCEDLLFVVRAYARDPSVSILADYPCYYWHAHEDGGNNSRADYGIRGHYERLEVIVREALGAKDARLREALLLRLLATELMNCVSPGALRGRTPARNRLAHALSGEVVRAHVPEEVMDRLVGLERLAAAALAGGSWEASRAVARRRAELAAAVTTADVRWSGRRLLVPFTVGVQWRGRPVVLTPVDDRLALPADLTDGLTAGPALRVEPFAGAWCGLSVRDRERLVSWWAPTDSTCELVAHPEGGREPRLTGQAVVDPLTVAGGGPLETGRHVLAFGVRLLGVGDRARVTGASPGRVVVGSPPRLVDARPTRRGLELFVAPASRALVRELSRGATVGRVRGPGRPGAPLRVRTDLAPVQTPDGPVVLASAPLRIRLRGGDRPELLVDRRTGLRTGRHPVRLRKHRIGTVLVLRGRVLWFRGWAPAASRRQE